MTCSAQRSAIRLLALGAAWFMVFATAPAIQAQTLTVLHSFTNHADGANPTAGMIMDRAGNLYGTTSAANTAATNSAFELKSMNSGWLLKPLADFDYNGRGAYGYALTTKPVIGPDGALYAAAQEGGNDNCFPGPVDCGTVIRLQPQARACGSVLCFWNPTVLYYFNGNLDGSLPAQIVFGADGSIYGTTLEGGTGCSGGNGCGTVYKLTNTGGEYWTKTAIYEFHGNDGSYPFGGVIFDAAGNLYGVTNGGGANDEGVVYELTPVVNGFWTQTILHTFQRSDGEFPVGPLTMDASGNLYGVATGGGANMGGTVFELAQPGTWNFQTLYNLSINFFDAGPNGGLLLDSAGSIYGTTVGGGSNGLGVVYKLTFTNGTWNFTDLHDFIAFEGQQPNGGLIFDASGNIYGTTIFGGNINRGTAWELTP